MPPLKTILRMNAASCIAFGVLFLVEPNLVAMFLGTPPAPSWLIAVLGAVLVLNGLHLLHTSKRNSPPRALILYFSAGDFAWALATLALIGGGLWITHLEGRVVALLVAAFVGTMGGMQMSAQRALRTC